MTATPLIKNDFISSPATKVPAPVIMRNIIDLKLISEAPEEMRSKYQVRKAANVMSMDELVASIRHNGVIFDLVVAKGEYVIAGNRRLTALRIIFADTPAAKVKTVDAEAIGGDPREIALATNVGLPMHPVDRYEVLASLVADGISSDDVASHYSLDARGFAQTMKLAALSPVIRNAWRDGELTASVAQAFCLTDDSELQEKLLKRLRKENGEAAIQAHQIRHFLVSDKQRNVGKFVEFVSADLYEAAGGNVNKDLFGMDHTVSDLKLLHKMVADQYNKLIDTLTADGWSWAVSTEGLANRYSHSDVSKPYTAEKKARSGVFIILGARGEVEYEYGKVRPQDQRTTASTAPKRDTPENSSGPERDAAKKEPAVASQALQSRMTLWMRAAAQSALVATAKAYDDPLMLTLAKIVAGQMDTQQSIQEQCSALLKLMPPKIVNEAVAKNFDDADYFGSISKDLLTRAIKEAGLSEQSKDIDKRADLTKFATSHVTKTGWLPKEMRCAHYAGVAKPKVKR